MSALLYLLVIDVACIASGTFLVATEHFGWAWIPFLLAFSTSVRTSIPNSPKGTES